MFDNFHGDSYNDFSSGKPQKIRLTPFADQEQLCGFLLLGRWPANTLEWIYTLIAAVQTVSIPGMLKKTTIFGVEEEKLEKPLPDTVGVLTAQEIPAYLDNAGAGDDPGRQRFNPHALMILHPPSETKPSLPEIDNAASGCVLLPGLPHLGLDHRAGWVEANAQSVITMRSQSGIDLHHDPDTAVMSLLLSA